MITASTISTDQLDLLNCLVEHGPYIDSEIQDKAALDSLINAGLAVMVCANGRDDYIASTLLGRNVYCSRYNATSLQEARRNRV